MISQLTEFLENEKGRLAAACRAVSDAGINMHALNLADTSDFGVVRMLTDTVYDNPHGLDFDAYAGDLHSTAADVAKVVQYAMTNDTFRAAVGGGSTTIQVTLGRYPPSPTCARQTSYTAKRSMHAAWPWRSAPASTPSTPWSWGPTAPCTSNATPKAPRRSRPSRRS